MKKVHITSLGCAKNLVDSEVIAGQLRQRRHTLVKNPHEAQIIIINTCGFIHDAKSESIQAIFEALDLKREDPEKKVYVAGCLTERYRQEISSEIPEIDAIFGTESYQQILNQLGEDTYDPKNIYQFRELSTPPHYAYLKISEGCDHSCSFCAIPKIRGKHISRPMNDILKEAEILAEKGVKELLLVSQDTSYYGKDLYKKPMIVQLLESLANGKSQ